jgi:hypothetical protein
MSHPSHLGLALVGLFAGTVFTVLWYLDHRTHVRIGARDLGDRELRTHRMILYASYGLQLSFIGFAWFPLETLPVFIGFYITRTLHEFIDETRFHTERCTETETLLHLGMWITIQTGIATLFIWGFFYRYEGIGSLPLPVLVAYGILTLFLVWIGHQETRASRPQRTHA